MPCMVDVAVGGLLSINSSNTLKEAQQLIEIMTTKLQHVKWKTSSKKGYGVRHSQCIVSSK